MLKMKKTSEIKEENECKQRRKRVKKEKKTSENREEND